VSVPYDLDAALTVLCQDPPLATLIQQVGSCRLSLEGRTTSPFEALLRAIVYQQLSGKAARVIHERLLALFAAGPTPEQLLTIDDQTLRGAGLSRAKIAALRDLATKTLDGVVPSLAALAEMDDLEIISRLTAVRGVGRWTVEMLLMFHLGRPDILPVNDLGVRKGFMLTCGLAALPSPAELLEYGKRWKPYRSVASWYLWRAVDLQSPFDV